MLSGSLHHVSDVGEATLGPGDVQRLTAGTGVVHAETSADPAQVTRFVQTWVRPAAPGLAPSYEVVRGALRDCEGALGELDVGRGSAARLHLGRVPAGRRVDLPTGALRHLLVATGEGTAGTPDHPTGPSLGAGDAVRVDGSEVVRLSARSVLNALVWVTA